MVSVCLKCLNRFHLLILVNEVTEHEDRLCNSPGPGVSSQKAAL